MGLPIDVLFIFVFAGLFGFGILYLGKAKAVVFVISLSLGTLFSSLFPFSAWLNPALENQAFLRSILPTLNFLLGFTLAFLFLRKAISVEWSGSIVKRWSQVILLSIATTGLVLSTLYTTLAFDQFYNFSRAADHIFLFGNSLFWWTLFTYGVLYYTLRR